MLTLAGFEILFNVGLLLPSTKLAKSFFSGPNWIKCTECNKKKSGTQRRKLRMIKNF